MKGYKILVFILLFSVSGLYLQPSLAEEKIGNVSPEKVLYQSQRSFDRAITLLSITVTLMGMILTAIFVLIFILGFFGFRELKQIRNDALRYVNEAKEYVEEARPVVDSLREFREEGKKLYEEIKNMSFDNIPEDIKKRLDEHGDKTKTFEKLGLHELGPKDYTRLATDYYLSGEYEEALKAVDNALKSDPDNGNLWNNRGNVLHALNRYEEALEAYEKALEIDSGNSDAWYSKACIYAKLNDKSKALKNLTNAIKLDNKFKDKAKKDEVFEKYNDDEDFRQLIEE